MGNFTCGLCGKSNFQGQPDGSFACLVCGEVYSAQEVGNLGTAHEDSDESKPAMVNEETRICPTCGKEIKNRRVAGALFCINCNTLYRSVL